MNKEKIEICQVPIGIESKFEGKWYVVREEYPCYLQKDGTWYKWVYYFDSKKEIEKLL